MKIGLWIGLICMGAIMLQAEVLEVVPVDIHERLYPDRWPKPAEPVAISVPRGAPVTFQFAVRAEAAGEAKLSVSGDIAGKARLPAAQHWPQGRWHDTRAERDAAQGNGRMARRERGSHLRDPPEFASGTGMGTLHGPAPFGRCWSGRAPLCSCIQLARGR